MSSNQSCLSPVAVNRAAKQEMVGLGPTESQRVPILFGDSCSTTCTFAMVAVTLPCMWDNGRLRSDTQYLGGTHHPFSRSQVRNISNFFDKERLTFTYHPIFISVAHVSNQPTKIEKGTKPALQNCLLPVLLLEVRFAHCSGRDDYILTHGHLILFEGAIQRQQVTTPCTPSKVTRYILGTK